MCNDLCELKTIVPDSCPMFHDGKDVVFGAIFRGSLSIVGKARTLDIKSETENIVYWYNDSGDLNYPTKEEFQKMIDNHLSINYNLSLPALKGIYSLWPHALKKDSLTEFQNNWLLQTSMKNIWTLALDPEYVYSRVFKEYDVFPEIIGTCGGIYFVEKVETYDFPYVIKQLNFDAWVERVKIALKILDLIEEFDNMFDYPAHLCDVKMDHFGKSENGRMKYLDSDNVYLKPIADKSVGDGSYCDKHSDCDLFDCQGYCDPHDNKCRGGVINNNLQIVCDRIFLGDNFGLRHYGSSGLLVSKHASMKLQQIVDHCSNPTGSNSDRRLSAGEDVLEQLKSSLKEIIAIHNKLQNE